MNRLTASMILSLLCVANAGTKAGSNSFSEPIRLATGDSPSAVAAADLTGDGILDLIAVHRVSDDAWVFVGDGQGGFAFLQSFAVGPFPQGIAAADLDGDQKADLATTAVPFNSGTATAWIGNGDGTFAFSSQLTADDGTRTIKIADFDRDQRPDLIVTNPTRDNVSVFLGDGDGTFGAELRTPVGTTGSYPTDLAIADFDGDGELDLATSNAQSSDASIGRLLGNGDGTFSAPTAFATSCSRPESIVAGDFNRDGQADLAVACFFSDEVAVLLGDGAGGFAAPQLYPLFPEAGNPYWILAVDLDRDGLDELVTANNGWFSVFEGTHRR